MESNEQPAMDTAERSKYREGLIDLHRSSITNFETGIMTLAGGALALSMTFHERFIGEGPLQSTGLLMTAWGLWIVSLLSILFSHLTASLAALRAIGQLDAGKDQVGVFGGRYATVTHVLNWASAVSLILGVIAFAVFVYANLDKP
jgi:hypothetical protein